MLKVLDTEGLKQKNARIAELEIEVEDWRHAFHLTRLDLENVQGTLRLWQQYATQQGLCPYHPFNRAGFCRNGPDCNKETIHVG